MSCTCYTCLHLLSGGFSKARLLLACLFSLILMNSTQHLSCLYLSCELTSKKYIKMNVSIWQWPKKDEKQEYQNKKTTKQWQVVQLIWKQKKLAQSSLVCVPWYHGNDIGLLSWQARNENCYVRQSFFFSYQIKAVLSQAKLNCQAVARRSFSNKGATKVIDDWLSCIFNLLGLVYFLFNRITHK